jgi:hypothetical protein
VEGPHMHGPNMRGVDMHLLLSKLPAFMLLKVQKDRTMVQMHPGHLEYNASCEGSRGSGPPDQPGWPMGQDPLASGSQQVCC